MKIDVLLGLQWGDEGKGKIVDVLTPEYDIIARFQGGPNAGHTLIFDGEKHVLHTIPSGIFHQQVINIIGNGVVIDPVILLKEINEVKQASANPIINLKISKKAHLILPTHRVLDAAYEQAMGAKKIGSTLKGIGPTYTDKVARKGVRIGDILSPAFREKYLQLRNKHAEIIGFHQLNYQEQKIESLSFEAYENEWFKAIEELKKYDLIDSEHYINQALEEGKSILAEGAQGSLLDIDFGSYPFVTSSNTTCSGVCSGLGVAPNKIGRVFGIFKAYCTRVGSGPFPTELFDETGKKMQINGNEFGSTTGRSRRCGWLDLPALNYAIMLNGVTHLMMMKSDVLSEFETINIGTAYQLDGGKMDFLPYEINEQEIIPIYHTMAGWNQDLTEMTSEEKLPSTLKEYISYIEKSTKTPISIVSVGPDRNQTIIREQLFA